MRRISQTIKKLSQVISVGFPLLLISPEVLAWSPKQAPVMTKWAAEVDPKRPRPEYPRPQMERKDWLNLNGIWQFAPAGAGDAIPAGQTLQGEILVPFPLESALSGVMEHHDRLWYRRTFSVPPSWAGRRVLLHFEAVDYESEAFVNGKMLGIHKGGYTPFSYDITDAIKGSGAQELVVRVFDPTEAGGQPRGKQTTAPGGIMYTPTTGIWQTVWLEPVPESAIRDLKIVPDVDGEQVKVTVYATGSSDGLEVKAQVCHEGAPVQVIQGPCGIELSLPLKNPQLWSTDHPFLYDLDISLIKNGRPSTMSPATLACGKSR